MEESIKEKTGKELNYWIDIVKQEQLEKHSDIVKFLKDKHNFSHGFANFVALTARKSSAAFFDEQELIENQYKNKENLLPIYEKIIDHVLTLGDDVEIAPKKANVSVRRKKQFILIQPSTKTRIDLGMKFRDKPLTDRLLTSGPFGTMCSNRVILTSEDEVDEELKNWIREAYDEAG